MQQNTRAKQIILQYIPYRNTITITREFKYGSIFDWPKGTDKK